MPGRSPVLHRLALVMVMCAVLLTAACAMRSGPPRRPGIRDYCQLDPAQDENEIRVLALYIAQFGGGKLVDRRNCLLQLTWVEFTENVPTSALRKLDEAGSLPGYPYAVPVVVILRGRYECGQGPYGHEGFYLCQFTATALERVLGRIPTAGPYKD